MAETFKTTNGLLLVWVILGFLVAAITIQQVILILLKEEGRGVKVIKSFAQKN